MQKKGSEEGERDVEEKERRKAEQTRINGGKNKRAINNEKMEVT
jgi:hypothetical protein